MDAGDALFWHRLQFAFTVVYHYLFPQLTIGLALLIVLMKAIGLRTGDRCWDDAARFWIRIFGVNFAFGIVTGIPMEFQLRAASWARRSGWRACSRSSSSRASWSCCCGGSGGSAV